MANCKSCNAEIEWVESATSGRPIPLDKEPTKNGNLAVVGGKAKPYTAEDAKVFRDRRTSHFATCKDAASWRKS